MVIREKKVGKIMCSATPLQNHQNRYESDSLFLAVVLCTIMIVFIFHL